MLHGRGLATVFAPLALLCFACSLIVDTSDIDQGCPTGQKLCGGLCVEIRDPAYGCKPDGCEPCLLVNAIPECKGNVCSVQKCLFGFGCPSGGGCEAFILVDKLNCGECGKACGKGQSCQIGACTAD